MATSDTLVSPKLASVRLRQFAAAIRIRDDSTAAAAKSAGPSGRRLLGRSHSLNVADWAGKWKEAFSLFDKDKDGFISGEELALEMERLGMPTQEVEVQTLLGRWDTDSKGALTLLEFTSLMNSSRCLLVSGSSLAANLQSKQASAQQQQQQQQQLEGRRHRLCCHASEDGALNTEELLELRAAFDLFDKDGDGALNRQEIQAALELLEEDATDDDVELVMSEADANGNGSVSFKEFCRVLQSGAGGGGSGGAGGVLFPGKSTYYHHGGSVRDSSPL